MLIQNLAYLEPGFHSQKFWKDPKKERVRFSGKSAMWMHAFINVDLFFFPVKQN